jgi:hypothetical protein
LNDWLAIFKSRIPKSILTFDSSPKDPTQTKDKSWQDALEAAYPLKIDRFAIRNGDLTYVDKGPFKPLHVTKLNFNTENIRNVKSGKGVYPSPVDLEELSLIRAVQSLKAMQIFSPNLILLSKAILSWTRSPWIISSRSRKDINYPYGRKSICRPGYIGQYYFP